MIDYEKKEYIRKLNQSEVSYNEKSWFIPIFTVRSKNKNKIRIVCDAAASVNNISLNSALLKGLDLLKSLWGILIRFIVKPVAICGDIREMFHQIRIAKDDQPAQQFLWRGGDMSENIQTYVMTVIANYVRDKNAKRSE